MHISIWLALLFIGINANNSRKLPSRIVGGTDARIEDYPYTVSIQLYDYHWCGGSIISKKYILTAAHCISFAFGGQFTVRAGSALHDEGGSMHKVDWNLTYPGNRIDMALLRVEQPFVFDKTRQPLKLYPHPNGPAAGTLANVTGWGRTHENATDISRRLQVVTVPLITGKSCSEAFNNTAIGPIVIGQFCAGYLGVGGKDACQADSGGPLVIGALQYGIVSTGIGCARPEYPGVYAAIDFDRPWISENSDLEDTDLD